MDAVFDYAGRRIGTGQILQPALRIYFKAFQQRECFRVAKFQLKIIRSS